MPPIAIPAPRDGTTAIPAEPTAAELGQPTIVGGAGFGLAPLQGRLQALYRRWGVRGRARRFDDWTYDLMDEDPAAGGSLDVLMNGVFSNKPAIVPRVRPRPGRPADDQARADTSKRMADLCQYGLDRMDTPLHEVLARLTRSAWKHGASLGDLVWGDVGLGEFKGKMVLKEIREIPRCDWDFAVDEFLKVQGYFGRGADGQYRLWGRRKFLALTWGGEGGDPRGTSIYNRAAEAWNFSDQLPAEWFKFAMRHGQPVPDLMMPQDADKVLNPATGLYESMEDQAARSLESYRAGKYMIRPFGSAFNLNEPKAEGNVFKMADDHCRRKIILAILLQARATMEAENGSKADSETSERILDSLNFYARRWVSRAVEWSPLYLTALYNEGPAVADEHTPAFDLGAVGKQDFAAMLTAFAALGLEAIPTIWPDMYAMANLPEASLEEVQAFVASQVKVVPAPQPPNSADANPATPKKGAA